MRARLGLGPEDSLALSVVRGHSSVLDGPAIFRLAGRFILYLSPETFPGGVGVEEAAIQSFHAGLAEALSDPLPVVLASGVIDGRRFMVVPAGQEFSRWRAVRWAQRRRVRAPFFAWLRGLAGASSAPSPEARAAFLENLGALAGTPELSPELRHRADAARARLEKGAIQPRFTPMHGDIWLGNVLLPPPGWGRSRFYVIDWGGARIAGFATYDLLRAAASFGIGDAHLRQELSAHAELLAIAPGDAPVFLLAALGHYLRWRGNMPLAQLERTAHTCLSRMDSALR